MALSSAEVLHIAQLADLSLTEEEVVRLGQELGAILAHVEQLNELDTSDVPPTTHLAVSLMPLRADRVVAGLSHAEAVESGPRVNSGAFAVPKFVDE